MPYNVKVLADSIPEGGGRRLTTFEATYPRFIHAECLTHRVMSRNSASSRAIPIGKMIERVLTDPAMPLFWGKNQRGMQAAEELGEYEKREARDIWLRARDEAVDHVRELDDRGVHKQLSNRLLEPFMFITTIITATEWDNFFHLRRDAAAQPEFKWLADEMFARQEERTPHVLPAGAWHLPLIDDQTRAEVQRLVEDEPDSGRMIHVRVNELLCKIATGRCARVSYLTHDGRRDFHEDIALHNRLSTSGHWSPFEHIAQADSQSQRSGNFLGGWRQYRKQFSHEHYATPKAP